MKQVKKVFYLIGIWLMAICVTISANAAAIDDGVAPCWDNTAMICLAHSYVEGEAECVVEIWGQPGVTLIDNIDIVYYGEAFASDDWIELARWDDLSVADDEFFWYDYVEGVQYGRTYRLTVSFDIHRDGTVEHIEDYFDRLY